MANFEIKLYIMYSEIVLAPSAQHRMRHAPLVRGKGGAQIFFLAPMRHPAQLPDHC